MRKLIFLALLSVLTISTTVSAQPWKEPEPPDFTTFVDLQLGSTGGELGISYLRTDLLGIGIFAEVLYNDALHTIESAYLTGFKLKFYRNSSPTRLFLGPVAGAHGYGGQVRPFAGLALGYDHFAGSETSVLEEPAASLRLGLELKAGADTRGDVFIGISVGFGFGWNNKYVRGTQKNY